ncbi:hypothetical protein [Vibrio casei]|nr:hypothetical protein [Vibrio casei]
MKDRALSVHIWSAIEAQAKTASESIQKTDKGYINGDDIEKVNEFELKRLRILVRQLEEESPN